VALTLPMAVLVAVLYGFSQLGADSELTAMRANGVSVFQMLRPVLAAGLLMTAANFVFIDQVLPRGNLRLLNLTNDIAQKKPTFVLKEQAINNLPQSQYFLQASRIEAGTGRMREIVIYDLSPPTARRVIYADSGFMEFDRVETFDPARGSWAVATWSLPWTAAAHGLAVVGRRLLLCGGFSGDAGIGATAASCELDSADQPGPWARLPSLPEARAAMGAAVINGRLVLVGGWAGDRSVLASVRAWQDD